MVKTLSFWIKQLRTIKEWFNLKNKIENALKENANF